MPIRVLGTVLVVCVAHLMAAGEARATNDSLVDVLGIHDELADESGRTGDLFNSVFKTRRASSRGSAAKPNRDNGKGRGTTDGRSTSRGTKCAPPRFPGCGATMFCLQPKSRSGGADSGNSGSSISSNRNSFKHFNIRMGCWRKRPPICPQMQALQTYLSVRT